MLTNAFCVKYKRHAKRVPALLTKEKGSIKVNWKLPTYPSPESTLTLTSHLRQNVGLGEGQVGSFPETLIEPGKGAKK